MSTRLLHGDCREVLKTLPDASVHCCVTSPPYFGLRDYGTGQWEGGDPACGHRETREFVNPKNTLGPNGYLPPSNAANQMHQRQFRDLCGLCGAQRTDSQIGLEATPDAYVAEIVAVFRELRRVLRNDGTLWLNLGDSYASTAPGTRNGSGTGLQTDPGRIAYRPDYRGSQWQIKPKDLIGIPWMVAFALRADGWYLRQDIIWSKPNPMPESVRDRCTKAHEYLFLLSKSPRYFWDAEAIREPINPTNDGSVRMAAMDGYKSMADGYKQRRPQREVNYGEIKGANKRSVWEVATQPFAEAHFATFPPALIEPCIMAGCPAKACAKCGKPWVRQLSERAYPKHLANTKKAHGGIGNNLGGQKHTDWLNANPRIDLGFSPSCSCNAATVAGTCLDPFSGAGTTGLVADRLGRNAILIELNAGYADMSKRRITDDLPLFAEVVAA